MVVDVLQDAKMNPQHLLLEVTESVFLRDLTRAATTLRELRNLGVRIGLDDFGTGFSSLVQMKMLPFTDLKIGRSFVSGLPEAKRMVSWWMQLSR